MLRSTHRHRGRSAARRAVALIASLVLVSGGVAACGKDSPAEVLDTFLTGWKSGDLSKVGFVTAAGAPIKATEVYGEILNLSGDLPLETLVVSRAGDPKETGEIASTPVKVDWTLPNGTPWSYETTVRMTQRDSDGWRVIWEPGIVHTALNTGDRLELRRVAAERAPILGADGKPLITPRPVVTVAIDPARVTDAKALATKLTAALKKIKVDVDLSDLETRIEDAQPGSRIDIVTLRQEDYLKIRSEVRPLDGTTFPEDTKALAPTRQFARALLGTVDLATRDDIDASPETVAQGDYIGHGGLQQRYDSNLRGNVGQSVVIARKTPDGETASEQVFSTKPTPGKPVKVTLDVATQTAADAAVASQAQPSALVAIKISDSSVLAVAHGPDGGGDNVAFTGQVPPGSTFKMVSTLGLLQKELITANTVVDCPKTKAVAGRSFRNSNDMSLGKVPFHTNFAKSCNTAFVNLAPKLGADGLAKAGEVLGMGSEWDLGMASFSGAVSPGDSAVELAAASFGQGKTVVSPLAMASATAAVARGKFVQPKLVLDPAPAKPAPDGPELEAAVVGPLRSMMREVVTVGTGTALRRVPGKPVFGKTGTAEFESGSPETHAWFIGWQGDVAFAIMVQKGGSGADAAVPIAQRFLTALNR